MGKLKGKANMGNGMTSQALMEQLDAAIAASRPAAPATPPAILSRTEAPMIGGIEEVLALQLAYPFDSVQQLAVRCNKSIRYINALTGTAAYRALYAKRKEAMLEALGVPELTEEIAASTRYVLQRLMEVVETTKDGRLLDTVLNTLLKAQGAGGFAPASVQQNIAVMVSPHQAEILRIRERSLALAREAGPYPPEVVKGQSLVESLPVLASQPGLPAGRVILQAAVPPIDAQRASPAEDVRLTASPSDSLAAQPASPAWDVSPSDDAVSQVTEAQPLSADTTLAGLEAELLELPGARASAEDSR